MNHFCKVILAIVILMILCFSTASVFAESLTDDEIARRIEFIQKRLDDGKIEAKRWQYSWMFIYGFASEVQFGLATTQTDDEDEHDRYDNVVGGITNLIGVGDLAVNPLTAWNAPEKLRDLPASTGNEKKAKLQYAEQLLKQCADREEDGRSWKTHALAGLVSVLGGAAILSDDGRGGDAAVFFGTSMAVAEIQIFSMPTRAVLDWKTYSAMSSKDFRADLKQAPANRFFISANPQGIFCTVLF